VRACNPNATYALGSLRFYPVPLAGLQTLRPQDRLRLFELHSSDSTILQNNFSDQGRRVSVTTGNGSMPQGLLPPTRRALC